MRKFILLLKKELKELITLQSILPLLVGVLMMFFLGGVIGDITKKEQAGYSNIAILNEDDSEYTKNIIKNLEKDYNVINLQKGLTDGQALAEAEKLGLGSFLRIPEGFGKSIYENGRVQQVLTITRLKDLSITGGGSSQASENAVSAINNAVSSDIISGAGRDAEFAKTPVERKDRVFVNDKSADISAGAVLNSMMSQSVILPIVMFIVIIFASQMIAAAIANEKADKTLETLLSAPVSRTSVLFAKISGAGLVALIYAAVYMIGFYFYMNGVSGGYMAAGAANTGTVQALQALGLQLGAADYLVIGLELFMSILIALCLALIIGATAKDVKAAQAGVAPLVFLIIIPYMLTMFTNIEKLPFIAKAIIYILPFTHSFTAMNNLFMANGLGVALGAVYQAVFLIFMVWLAVRLFNSDKILTMKLEFRRKGRRYNKQ